jgi:hypothetical protein
MLMLDEKALRKSTFDEANSAPVVLADGQSWFLPKPFLRLRPKFSGGRAAGYGPLTTADPVWNELRQAVQDSGESDTLSAIASLGAYMICRNYELTDDQLGDLFSWDSNQTWAAEVISIANGRTGPKASSGGDTLPA